MEKQQKQHNQKKRKANRNQNRNQEIVNKLLLFDQPVKEKIKGVKLNGCPKRVVKKTLHVLGNISKTICKMITNQPRKKKKHEPVKQMQYDFNDPVHHRRLQSLVNNDQK